MKLIIIFFISNFLFSQEKVFLNNENFITGIDYKNEVYLILNKDFYYVKKFENLKWTKKTLKYNEISESIDFPFNFFHVNERNYLVHKGCGTVYEFKNDSITRIDNSFEHKNQFMSSNFIYDDEIYYFGGYGLFTFKNILTKFDFKTKEWELIKYKNSNIPEPRANGITFVQNEKLFLIGGLTEDFETNLTTTTNKRLNDIWELNLKTKEWEYLGEIENSNFLNFIHFQSVINEELIFDHGKLYKFDFVNNTLKTSEPRDIYTFSSYEKYNPITNEIFYILAKSDQSDKTHEVIIENYNNYISEFKYSETLIKSNNSSSPILVVMLIIFILMLFFVLAYLHKRKKTRTNVNKIYLKGSVFYYRDKIIHNLTNDENDLLLFFFKQKENPTPMNEVVDFFSKNDNTTYNTLTKKKDLVLNGLKQKLAFILEVNEDELFISQKNTEDKRIKEIQLNTKCFLF